MKIGIFGGAFNPVHNGHLHLAAQYLQSLSLDKILFVPTAVPPHKTAAHLASPEDRMAMLSLAIGDNAAYTLCDLEFRREGKSYTYDTVCALKAQYPQDEFYLIIGSDQYFYFPNWYRYEALLSLVTVCTAAREQAEYERLLAFQKAHKEMAGTVVQNLDVVAVSSSQIRERVQQGKAIDDFVPPRVAEYIKAKGLYEQTNSNSAD